MVLLVLIYLFGWAPRIVLGMEKTPHWVSTVMSYLMMAVAAAYACAALIHIEQLKRLRGKACWKCHYILDAETNSERCPECGMDTATSMANWRDTKWLGK